MHSPMKVKNLISILNKIDKNKEVLIRCAFNDYDIVSNQENKDNITLYLKMIDKRNEIDDDDKRNV